jgi:hypothetical protein
VTNRYSGNVGRWGSGPGAVFIVEAETLGNHKIWLTDRLVPPHFHHAKEGQLLLALFLFGSAATGQGTAAERPMAKAGPLKNSTDKIKDRFAASSRSRRERQADLVRLQEPSAPRRNDLLPALVWSTLIVRDASRETGEQVGRNPVLGLVVVSGPPPELQHLCG